MTEVARGRCPVCGRFCRAVTATRRETDIGACLDTVTGTCRQHGRVDLSHEPWSWEDFFGENE